MPLQIVRNDITKMNVDAIVNAAKSSLLGGGGVDGCIHKVAGPALLKECKALGGCFHGDAKITKGYKLPCKYVIHTVGPIYKDGKHGERDTLVSCYTKSLQLAKENNCESIAFPLISAGTFGYPKDEALRVAVDTISSFLMNNDMAVYLVIFDKNSYQISEQLFKNIETYIDDRYVDTHFDNYREMEYSRYLLDAEYDDLEDDGTLLVCEDSVPCEKYSFPKVSCPSSLDDALSLLDESFSEMLLRKIDEKGITDSQCYKKANVDRKLFSKIRNDKFYKPGKATVIAFAMALELPLPDTKEMLLKAGFALSHSSKFDIIVEYFISHGNYNVFELNEVLFAFDQNLIGA